MSYVHDPNDLTPLMTSDTTPSPNVASASSSYATYLAWRAFDHVPSPIPNYSIWLTFNYPPNYVTWLQFDFGAGHAQVVNRYRMTNIGAAAGVSNGDNPRDWLFQGYNGSSWDTLDSRADIEWVVDETKEFSFSNAVAYEKYRIYITEINVYAPYPYLAIAELELFYDAPTSFTLVVNDLSHADGIGAVALTQVHNLAVADLNHANAIGSVVLSQIHQLVVQDLNHSQSLDDLSLSQIHNLLVQDLSHAQDIDNVGLYSILYDLLRPLMAESREETISAPHTRRVFRASHRRREFS
jgi:hypothetical protein